MRTIRGTRLNDILNAPISLVPIIPFGEGYEMFGEEGDDVVNGSAANDILHGGTGRDTLSGGKGNDTLDGGSDADAMDGGAGIDTASYETSGAGVRVNLATGSGRGGDAEGDTLRNVENLTGSKFNDALTGNTLANVLVGNGGRDRLFGDEGDDTLEGGEGADTLDGGLGIDTARYTDSRSGVTVNLATGVGSGGSAEGDKLAGIEVLIGSNHNDRLTGDAQSNDIRGGAGNDTLSGGDALDRLDGGSGNDTVDYSGSQFGVHIDLEITSFGNDEGAAFFDLNGDGSLTAADDVTGEGQFTLADMADVLVSIENVIGTEYTDLILGSDADNYLSGMGGADGLIGGVGNDTVDGGAGDDELDGASGNDLVLGGDGADDVEGDAGDDTLEGGAGGDDIDGGTGRDTASYATSNAGVFIDLLNGTAAGGHAHNDVLTSINDLIGSEHGDVLLGTNGDNKIEGGAGDDIIRGRDGVDELWGGAGNDTFVIDESDDSNAIIAWNVEAIGDFTAGGTEDVIDLSNAGTGYTSLADILANSQTITGTNGETALEIDLGPSGLLYLIGVEQSELTEADFVF